MTADGGDDDVKRPSPSPEDIQHAETIAAHKALEVFVETLKEELEKIGVTSIVEVLKKTEHVHVALIVGDVTCAIRHTVVFDDSAIAIHAAILAPLLRG